MGKQNGKNVPVGEGLASVLPSDVNAITLYSSPDESDTREPVGCGWTIALTNAQADAIDAYHDADVRGQLVYTQSVDEDDCIRVGMGVSYDVDGPYVSTYTRLGMSKGEFTKEQANLICDIVENAVRIDKGSDYKLDRRTILGDIEYVQPEVVAEQKSSPSASVSYGTAASAIFGDISKNVADTQNQVGE